MGREGKTGTRTPKKETAANGKRSGGKRGKEAPAAALSRKRTAPAVPGKARALPRRAPEAAVPRSGRARVAPSARGAEYGVDCAVLLPRDPRTAFFFWEVAEDTIHRRVGRQRATGELALRMTEEGTGHLIAEGRGVARTGSWYFNLPRAGVRALAAVGWRGEDGDFTVLLTSNAVHFPREAPGEGIGEEATAGGRTFAELFRLSGGDDAVFGRGGGSHTPHGERR